MIADTVAMDTQEAPNRRFSVTSFVELLVLAVVIAVGIATYLLLTATASPQRFLPPVVVAVMLVANLLPGTALLVLIGRRFAMQRAARSPTGGRGHLHVRLVALFSTIAAVPTFLVVIFASLLFQYGVQFWYSDQARDMIQNATGVAKTSYEQMLKRWQEASVTAAQDISENFSEKVRSPDFGNYFGQYQIFYRSFSDGFLFVASPQGEFREIVSLNPDRIDLAKAVSIEEIRAVQTRVPSITTVAENKIRTLVPIPGATNVFLLTVATSDVSVMEAQSKRSAAVLKSYQQLLEQSQSLQLKFNAALLAISLLIIAIAVWIALEVADRLVRPLGDLVQAADRISTGDLAARAPTRKIDDEFGTLTNAFNAMTSQLQAQTGALESRRALIEAVMSGVSAGVVSTGRDGTIRLINRSAAELLNTGANSPVGRQLADIAPELAALIGTDQRDAIIEVDAGGEARTLAVRIARADAGPILTFDDITQQLLDQRRAAWSDVARRIAHEIKNPLTPIQLAAERLQRRYGKQIVADDGTFARLTETIVRQVGDLRRMVDEFSSFARMPKPLFKHESLVDIARQSLFLHEVAHPGITFSLVSTPASVDFVCDRRQIGQALTNIIKNAVEAIEAQGEGVAGDVSMSICGDPARSIVVEVCDNGVGLPAARDRIAEPYMTTRARGTGLGLAIVNKIVEEHCGTMSFGDRPGGGTIVTMRFDAAALSRMEAAPDTIDGDLPHDKNDRLPAELTRIRT